MKNYNLNFKSEVVPFNHYWELCVGSCHGTTALREDYRRQLEQCHKELGFKYVRFHGLFNDDMNVMYRTNSLQSFQSEESNKYVLSFTNTDSIFDFLLSIGMKPFIELSFMPSALTSGKCSIFHYRGLTSPPYDYEKWGWLVEQFTAHCVERYGLGEVRQWFFEVWNEPNLGGPKTPQGFWGGTMDEYFKLYKYAVEGIKKVDSRLRVGGPASSDGEWITDLIQFCEASGTPIDFASTHDYPTDYAAGSRHGKGVKLDVEKIQAMPPEEAAKYFASFIEQDQSKWKMIPRGILTEFAKEARAEARELPLYYTEWNANSSSSAIDDDGPFGASFILKTIMDNHGLVEGYSYWTFTDIFEEGGMPHVPFHGGFGLLNLQGIPKASYRAFQLLHKLGNKLYTTKLNDGTVDIYAVNNEESSCIQILAVNHQSLMQAISAEDVTVYLKNLPGFAGAEVERIDENHANAIRRWYELGSPDYPPPEVMYDILAASYLKVEKLDINFKDGTVRINITLPEQSAALITVYF
jgi:xylan 1,4-beta-xylosidase